MGGGRIDRSEDGGTAYTLLTWVKRHEIDSGARDCTVRALKALAPMAQVVPACCASTT